MKHQEGELGIIGLSLVLVGCLIITFAVLATFDVITLTDSFLTKFLILFVGVSLGLTEVTVGWLFANHREK